MVKTIILMVFGITLSNGETTTMTVEMAKLTACPPYEEGRVIMKNFVDTVQNSEELAERGVTVKAWGGDCYAIPLKIQNKSFIKKVGQAT